MERDKQSKQSQQDRTELEPEAETQRRKDGNRETRTDRRRQIHRVERERAVGPEGVGLGLTGFW